METQPATYAPHPMHEATVLTRQVLVLNEAIEYLMRREMDINETDFQAMQHLLKNRGMSPGELAKALHLTSAATTTVVDRLVLKGHAVREPHPTDRRRLQVIPSPTSVRDAMGHLMPMIMQIDQMVSASPAQNQRAVVEFLHGVVAAMNERIAHFDSHTGTQPPEPEGDALS
ncbi:MarR family winged helix-turn-helix transcriptional regulator [Pseudarthrobacter sp. P1]|uniref:MarR family winged helix-turn-helix transcriptional regulator n=1 Tax=Pseudarthrobacter sp. P1 TaxID=3418418 RepID=UPI003CE9A847